MNEKLSRQELIELWLAASDEAADASTFTDEQRAALNQMIEEDAEVRRGLVALSRQQAWLMWHGSNQSESIDAANADAVVARIRTLIETADKAEAEELSQRARVYSFLSDFAANPGALFRPPLVFFLLLLAGLVGAFVSRQIGGSPELAARTRDEGSTPLPGAVAADGAPRLPTPAAYLTLAHGCNWGSTGPQLLDVGQGIQAGDEIALTEGIAEFRLANGVALGVEGPAALMLASPSALVLQYGKLTAHVPWGVDDFKVVTAGCRLVSRSAEFGVSLMGNKLDIHAFAGEVIATSSMFTALENDDEEDDDLSPPVRDDLFAVATVTAGNALHLTSHGEVLRRTGWGKAAPGSFVAKLSMSGPLPVTQDYVDRVKASKPIAYWRFEQIDGLKVANEIKSGPSLVLASTKSTSSSKGAPTDSKQALIEKGKLALVGSALNHSFECRPDSDWYLRSKSPLGIDGPEYSMELWVKPSHLHLGSIVNLDCGDDHHSMARLELQGGVGDSFSKQHPGLLRYVHRAYKGKPRDFGVSCFSSRPYAVRRWQHLVGVKTKTELKLYLDGKLISSEQESQVLPCDPAIRVGIFHSGTDRRRFIGQLDELAIYNRALSAEEIESHYKTLKQAMEQFDPREAASQRVRLPRDA